MSKDQAKATALLLILHGSPREKSSDPARQISQSPELTAQFDHVMLAFMECNEPSIPQAINECATLGMSKIIAVPYMLHTGRHLVLDVPGQLLEAVANHPEIEILLGCPLGTMPQISDCLISRANEAVSKAIIRG